MDVLDVEAYLVVCMVSLVWYLAVVVETLPPLVFSYLNFGHLLMVDEYFGPLRISQVDASVETHIWLVVVQNAVQETKVVLALEVFDQKTDH